MQSSPIRPEDGRAAASQTPATLDPRSLRILRVILLFMAACGLLVAGYAAHLGAPWWVLALPALIVAIPLRVLATTRGKPYSAARPLTPGEGGRQQHSHSSPPTSQPAAGESDAYPPVSDPLWARVITCGWCMWFVFPAIFATAGIAILAKGGDPSQTVPVILFRHLPVFVSLAGAAVFFATSNSLEQRFGIQLRGVSFLQQSRMLRDDLSPPVRRRLAANLVGAALFMPAIGWEIFGWLAAVVIYQ